MQRPRRWQIQGPGAVLTRPRTLVLGIGNPIRNDDGVGPVVADEVHRALSNAEQTAVEVRSLDSGGWNLIPEIEGFDALVLIDAYFSGDSVPGRVRTHESAKLQGTNRPPDSAHLIGVGDALRLSKNLGYHTPELLGAVTVDIGDSCMFFGETLSPEILAAVPSAASAVRALLEGYLGKGSAKTQP